MDGLGDKQLNEIPSIFPVLFRSYVWWGMWVVVGYYNGAYPSVGMVVMGLLLMLAVSVVVLQSDLLKEIEGVLKDMNEEAGGWK